MLTQNSNCRSLNPGSATYGLQYSRKSHYLDLDVLHYKIRILIAPTALEFVQRIKYINMCEVLGSVSGAEHAINVIITIEIMRRDIKSGIRM